MTARRLSIAYIVPGHNLLASAGPTRNVLSLSRALGRVADVTVAFRRAIDPPAPGAVRVLEIEPGGAPGSGGGEAADDAAVRGVGLGEFFRYVGAVRRFTDRTAPSFDVVLEKSWILSGYVAARSARLGIPGILVENIPPLLHAPGGGLGALPKRLRQIVARSYAGRCARRASRVIAETDELKLALVDGWRLDASAVDVVGLGVDRDLFRPGDREEARRLLRIDPDATMLLYAGVLDRTHSLGPLLEALRAAPAGRFVFHIAGDGGLRGEYEKLARAAAIPVVFHGRVPHERMPVLIRASDLCVAPYETTVFPGGRLVYSTLKVPEYMACGRPVASVPSGGIRRMIRHGETGFLLANEREAWGALLRELPPRDRLREMGEAAAREAPAPDWGETAARYLEICEREVARARRAGAPRERS
ncbi:MAG: glycosyltransferase [Candidatus Latescibacterota bacterium]|nr:MAG: glycosyltransferase [Candidatus Latescibacterota bacterium]